MTRNLFTRNLLVRARRAPCPASDATVLPAARAAAAVAVARLEARAAAGDPKAAQRLACVRELRP
jgi:hypothetical protein